MKRILVLTGILWWFGNYLHSQTDSLAILAIENEADSLYRARQYDRAVVLYQQMIDRYQEARMIEKTAEGYLALGNTYYRLQQPRKAIDYYHNCVTQYLKLFPEDEFKLHRPYMGLSAAYQTLGHVKLQREFQYKSHELILAHHGPNHVRTAISFSNMGSTAAQFGDYLNALDYYHRALPILQIEHPQGHERISGLLVNMGIAYSHLDDIEQAIEYFHKAIHMDILLGGENHWVLAYNYLDLGQAYGKIGQDTSAMHYIQKSIPIAIDNDLYEVHGTSLYELGRLAAAQDREDQALDYFYSAIDVIINSLSKDHHSLALNYTGIADIQFAHRQFSNAESNYNLSLNILSNAYGKRHPRLAEVFAKKSRLFLAQDRFDLAHEAIMKGLKSIDVDSSNHDQENASWSTLSLPKLLDLKLGKADIFQRQFEVEKDIGRLSSALSLYEEADQIINHLRRGFINNASKAFFQEKSIQIYDRALQVCLKLGDLTGNEIYLERAFSFSEQNKSILLGESLYANTLTGISGIPEGLLKDETDLRSSIQQAKTSLIDHPDDSLIRTELDILKHKYDSLVLFIKQTYPDYFDLKYNHETIRLSAVRQFLEADEALLSFFQGDSLWTIFLVLKDSCIVSQKPRNVIDDALPQFRKMVSDPRNQFLAPVAHQLYEQLIPPFLQKDNPVERLVIIPDGLLGHIPFETLLTGTGKDPRLNYLVQRYSITMANSATLFCQRQQGRDKKTWAYVGFAPVYGKGSKSDFRDSLSDLPFARKEIAAGRKIFKGLQYIDQEATETNFRLMRESSSVLHLAMHTLVEDKSPERSRLIFSKDADTLADGSLHAYEIYNTAVSSDLVILSGCNTGYGQMHRGEGIMSLSRAFMYAGCSNVVMSLWRVGDQPTFTIVTQFLTNLKKGMRKMEALREAKLNYLQQADPVQAHPANWASLILMGDTKPLTIRSGKYYYWAALMLIFTILGLSKILKSRLFFNRRS
ncbi:MAG: CHAT domain-containing protein [Saprospiraceae bacterium]|nr:CHAT domain-containing protein [Saprospiraceae bacterium]